MINLARSDSQICPISAVLNYLHLRGNAPGPLFIFKDGLPLTGAKFSYLVVDTVKAAGWQGNFTSYSFRGWSSNFGSFAGYTRSSY